MAPKDKIIKVIRHKNGYRTFVYASGKRLKGKILAIWTLN